jgi:hypothetical protein
MKIEQIQREREWSELIEQEQVISLWTHVLSSYREAFITCVCVYESEIFFD